MFRHSTRHSPFWAAAALLALLAAPHTLLAQDAPPTVRAKVTNRTAKQVEAASGQDTVPTARGNYRLRPPRSGYYWSQYGLQVTGVTPGSPAWRQGLEPGDIIASVNGHQVATLRDLRYWISTTPYAAQLQVIDCNTGRWVWVTVYPIHGLLGVAVQPTLLPGYGPWDPPLGQPNQGGLGLEPNMPPMPTSSTRSVSRKAWHRWSRTAR